MAAGKEARFMEVLVGRSFDDDFGLIQHRCRNCGWTTTPSPIPLYVLAASNLDQLTQIMMVNDLTEANSVRDLSPGAQEIAEQYSLNPFLMAEAAAAFAVNWRKALERIGDLSEQLARAEQ
jgi:hypothetical protein